MPGSTCRWNGAACAWWTRPGGSSARPRWRASRRRWSRFFRQLGLPLTRIGLEAGPLSQWLHAGLTGAGFDGVLLETRQVKAALSAMVVKTDGWMAPVGIIVPRRRLSTQSQGGHPMQISTIGIDLAKRVFQIHGVDQDGNVVLRKQLRRAQVLGFFAKLPPCLVGMEACGTSHHWARELQRSATRCG